MNPIFSLLSASAGVTALIGAPPQMRCYNSGFIPETPTVNAALPCVTHQQIAGTPANLLAAAPGVDGTLIQVNVWAVTAVEALTLMQLVRDALEAGGQNVMVNAPQDNFEPDTKRFGWMLEFYFWVYR